MRSCTSAQGPASDPVTGTYSYTNIPAPGPGVSRGPGLSDQELRCSNRQSQGGRTDRSHALGQRRRLLLGFHDGHHAQSAIRRTQPGHRLSRTPARTCRWTGTGLTRTTAARLTCRCDASSYHPGGVNALFADGSVHFVKNSISPVTWYAWAPSPAARSSAPINIDSEFEVPASLERPRGTDRHPSARGLLFCPAKRFPTVLRELIHAVSRT